jgi:SAM-dependent methyltransferase
MLAAAVLVLDRQEPHISPASGEREALIRGRRLWKRYFARQAFVLTLATNRFGPLRYPKAAIAALRLAPMEGAISMLSTARNYARKRLPPPAILFLKRLRGVLPFGRFNFGDFARTQPVSSEFGFDRGTPVDRYYIEAFLARQSADIRGRTLEIGDDSYTRQFGGSRVRQADVLHVNADNAHATIVGDMSVPETLPQAAFDCLVLTQTLHLIYDMSAAVTEMHRALKPGGVVLLTVPGISQIDRGEWGSTWYWAITPAAAIRLFGDVFGPDNVQVESHGNVYAATTFLQGLALEEVDHRKLNIDDPAYPVIVTVRAQKQG